MYIYIYKTYVEPWQVSEIADATTFSKYICSK